MLENLKSNATLMNQEGFGLNSDEDSVLREELKLLLKVQQGLLLETAEDL